MNELNILLIKDGGANWIAQCLEHDIAAQGQTIRAAMKSFEQTLISEVAYSISKGTHPLANIPPAPKFFWRTFDEIAEPIRQPKRTPYMPMFDTAPPAFMIPAFRELRAA